ncbi:hypothetical protein PIB30_035942 [Stylosanthes scabra]|uniref:Secreted protein n=1 Tax=Stylosanthes scabra TaxID=79078 RepID=A0ABU6ZAT9_9FABA|nr:hypothetical protein [Stylosanthes scabra]
MSLTTAAIGSACWRAFNERGTRSPAAVKIVTTVVLCAAVTGIRCGKVVLVFGLIRLVLRALTGHCMLVLGTNTATPATVSTLGIAGRTLLSLEPVVGVELLRSLRELTVRSLWLEHWKRGRG